MSGIYLNTISENASRLGMRLQETFSERTRDFSFSRRSTSLYLDTPDDKVKNLGRQLDSNSDREKLDALKRLVAFISKGRDVSEYFAQVVKNVASQNFEIRKLVYIYLLRHAEHEPDLALLSINTFQKDLTDPSPLIRAMALRVLSGIKVTMIGNLVVLAIKKCAADISPYVRTGAALAIPKCYNLDIAHLPALIDIIATLLRDRSPLTIGSVAIAFDTVCPTRLDLLHQQYRRLCRTLLDVDEWGQVHLLNLLARYAKTMLAKPTVIVDGLESRHKVDPDLQLLLSSSEPLLQSRNPAVVLAVARVFYYLGPPSQVSKVLHPLLRFLHGSAQIERVVLTYIVVITKTVPHIFSPFYSRFLIRATDMWPVKQEKVRILLNIIDNNNHQAILREFIDHAEDMDDRLVTESIHAAGRCAHVIPDCLLQCLTALIAMIKSTQHAVVSNAILVLKYLIQTQPGLMATLAETSPQSPLTIISHLARRVDSVRHPQARASVLWLVGQYSILPSHEGGLDINVTKWAPDVLRKSAKSFCQEAAAVKLQIISLAAKLVVLCPADQHLGLLSHFVFSLAKYDSNYDVRDRARMLTSLLAGLSPSLDGEENRGGVILRREQVKLVLFDGKEAVAEEVGNEADHHVVIGYLGAITGKTLHGNVFLLDWEEAGTESSLRDTDDDTKPITATTLVKASQRSKEFFHVGTPPGAPYKDTSKPKVSEVHSPDLEKFYANDDESEDGFSSSQDENSSHDTEESDGAEDGQE